MHWSFIFLESVKGKEDSLLSEKEIFSLILCFVLFLLCFEGLLCFLTAPEDLAGVVKLGVVKICVQTWLFAFLALMLALKQTKKKKTAVFRRVSVRLSL